jgi:hypothetical protein
MPELLRSFVFYFVAFLGSQSKGVAEGGVFRPRFQKFVSEISMGISSQKKKKIVR